MLLTVRSEPYFYRGRYSRFASPPPKPDGFGLRLRAKRKNDYGLNEEFGHGWHAQRLCDGRGAVQVGFACMLLTVRSEAYFYR
jgi:hypothetical protein